MSLFRKLIFAVTVLVILMLLSNGYITLQNSRQYLSGKLQSLANDTANYLGVSISQAAQERDKAYIQAMINAVFDQGDYSRVVYIDISGQEVVHRSRELSVQGVPQWFVNWADIPERTGKAGVDSGWYQLGKLYVSVHPGYAYKNLWLVLEQQLLFALFIAVLGYVVAGLGLKVLLRPLRRIEEQAEAICNGKLPEQKPEPSTPELRSVVKAMNRMVEKLQNINSEQVVLGSELRRDIFIDPVTHLSNAADFDAQMQAWMHAETEGGPAVLMLAHVRNTGSADHPGEEALLFDIAQIVARWLEEWPAAFAARRGRSDFAIFIPGLLLDEAGHWLAVAHRELSELTGTANAFCWLGASVSNAAVSSSKMMSVAESALRLAKSSDRSDWAVYPVDDPLQEGRHIDGWREFIAALPQSGNMVLYSQPMFSAAQSEVGREVFCRAKDGDRVIAAGAFWPLAERFGLAPLLDKAVLTQSMSYLKQNSDKVLCVNVTPSSFLSVEFEHWLLDCLKQDTEVSQRLTLEFNERILTTKSIDFELLHRMITDTGAQIGIDHFGVYPAAMGQLQSLQLSYVKIDRRFIEAIDTSKENRFYVQTLIQIAHGCDISIFADGVESDFEWRQLKKLKVDGGQGYFLANPSEMDDET